MYNSEGSNMRSISLWRSGDSATSRGRIPSGTRSGISFLAVMQVGIRLIHLGRTSLNQSTWSESCLTSSRMRLRGRNQNLPDHDKRSPADDSNRIALSQDLDALGQKQDAVRHAQGVIRRHPRLDNTRKEAYRQLSYSRNGRYQG